MHKYQHFNRELFSLLFYGFSKTFFAKCKLSKNISLFIYLMYMQYREIRKEKEKIEIIYNL